MQTLFGILGEEQFFVGGRPDNVSDYAKRFMLQIGVSAAAFTTKRRRGTKMVVEDFSRAGARFLTSRASIHKSLQDRYHRNANRMNWTTESISEILLRAGSKGKGNGNGKRTAPSADQDIRISPVGVLSSLVTAMQGEVNELAFGYLPMHRMSWKILRAIRTRCEPYFKETYGSDFTLKEWELPFMVGHILPLAHDESMDMLQTAGKAWDKLNYGDTTSIGMRRMCELSGIDYGILGIQNQVFQAFTNPHGSLVDDSLDHELEESDDENFSVTVHEVSMGTGQVTSHRERISSSKSKAD